MISVTDEGTGVTTCRVGGVIDPCDTDVVVILAASAAVELANSHFRYDRMKGPEQFKISKFQVFLADSSSPAVQMPSIYTKSNLVVFFEDGRHRATVLAGMMTTVPVLTKHSLAQALRDSWGSKGAALKEYDFSACTIQQLIGHP